MRLVAEELHMKVPQMRSDSMELRISKGASPCVAGGFSMEGVLTVPHKRDFSQVAEVLKTVGQVKYSPEFEVVMVKTKNGTLKMFGGGHISGHRPHPGGGRGALPRRGRGLPQGADVHQLPHLRAQLQVRGHNRRRAAQGG